MKRTIRRTPARHLERRYDRIAEALAVPIHLRTERQKRLLSQDDAPKQSRQRRGIADVKLDSGAGAAWHMSHAECPSFPDGTVWEAL